MKYHIILGIFFLLGAANSRAQETPKSETATEMTTKFKVYGNCGMCEKRIEKAARLDGVSFADWSEETKILTVTFDSQKVKPGQIHKAVAAVGHDTDRERAPDEVYEALHGCCQYERRQ